MKKHRYLFTIDPPVMEELREVAFRKCESKSSIVQNLIEEYLEKEKQTELKIN